MHAIDTHEGYSNFTELEKVTYLTQDVVTNDINQPLCNIEIYDELHDDFEVAQRHVASLVCNQKAHSNARSGLCNLSALRSKKNGGW